MNRPPATLAALRSLLRGAQLVVEGEGAAPFADVQIHGAAQDSRRVRAGDLFLAWRGGKVDAHDHVAEAEARGAAAALVERIVPGVSIPQLLVTDGRLAAALVADALAGSPGREMALAAITGTNGKTTTAVLARHLLGALGPSAALGTLGVMGADGALVPGTEGLTTPGPVELSDTLRRLADQGIRSVVMEASSHALDQRRLDGLRFRAVAFTNLSQDHLDYHGSLELYREAKIRLLELLAPGGGVVVNAADPAWEGVQSTDAATLSFIVEAEAREDGVFPTPSRAPARLRASSLETNATSTRFALNFDGEEVQVQLPLPGAFNVENALAAAGIALALGVPLAEVAFRLGSAPQVPGRLEVVCGAPVRVLIDFAHTPEALERVLDTLRPLVEGRLIVVFGAGGDRDRAKRPRMGAAVATRADLAVVTSDNPRTEDPDAIVDDIVEGMGSAPFERVVDRRAAIARALELAGPGDVVLLAGKGHERTQTIGGEKLPFDERVVVRELLAGRAA